MGEQVFISLGSNVAPERNLPASLRLLAASEHMVLLAVSRVYETVPIGPAGKINPEQAKFLNAAVLAETALSHIQLKTDVLYPIEAELGRVRTTGRFAPRSIDLDIALYGNEIVRIYIERPEGWPVKLIIPDPDIERRAHVALPLADIGPDYVHPVAKVSLADIAARFRDSPDVSLHLLKLSL